MSRTYGETRNCAGCRFWSEMIARAIGGRGVEAICLADEGPHAGKYTTGRVSCDAWKSGHLGAIDARRTMGRKRATYAAEEGE